MKRLELMTIKFFATRWLMIVGSVFCSVLTASAAEAPKLTPEFFAVLRSGDVRQLRDALDRGASENARDAAGNTALMHATVYGSIGCVKLLLDRGAEVNAANAAGARALMRASDDARKIELLVERGANVNAQSAFGNTPLMLAARRANSHSAVELLLAHGADAKATNHFGATALMA